MDKTRSRPSQEDQLWLGPAVRGCVDYRNCSVPNVLREYISTARIIHDRCWNCHDYIYPGEKYRGTVWAFGNTIDVQKEHLDCPPDPDGDWEENDDSEKETKVLEFTPHQRIPQKQAA